MVAIAQMGSKDFFIGWNRCMVAEVVQLVVRLVSLIFQCVNWENGDILDERRCFAALVAQVPDKQSGHAIQDRF